MEKIKEFLISENISFRELKNYELPFLHSSYTHETPWDDESYERLEFLGDAILGKIVSEFLYKNFPDYSQGNMTLLKHYFVNKNYLSIIGKELKLEQLMWLGAGENRNNLSDSVYEDVFEALIGAIYLDAGESETKKFLKKHILDKIKDIPIDEIKDPKTRLQELLQSEKRKSVQYDTDVKLDKDKLFNSKAVFDGFVIGKGKGKSKKEAEKAAASDALVKVVSKEDIDFKI